MGDESVQAIVAEMREYITRQVGTGFYDPTEVIDSAVEVFCDDAGPDVLRPIAARLTREAVASQLLDQASWPEMTDCDRLDEALAELTRKGIVCRQNFSCCGNCGVAEIGGELRAEREAGLLVRGYAFYHMQDTEAAAERHGICLNYGAVEPGAAAAVGVGYEIVAVLQSHGLESHWNGRGDTRIRIILDWKRRLPAGGAGGRAISGTQMNN